MPLFVVHHLPLQDLPQHFATLRTLADLHDPRFGLADYAARLGETQYISLYICGLALAKVVGVRLALLLLLAGSFVGTVLTTYWLAERLGGDGRAALFAVPALYNAMFIMGFVQFTSAIPVMLGVWVLAFRYRDRPSWMAGLALAAAELFLFYSHLVPFAIAQIGLLAIVRPLSARAIRDLLVIVAPTAVAVLRWRFATAAGRAIGSMLTTSGMKVSLTDAVRDFYFVGFDVWNDSADERSFLLFAAAALFFGVLAPPPPAGMPAVRRWLAFAPLVCVILFFVSQDNNAYMYYIRHRYPVVFVFAMIPLLRIPSGWSGHVASLALVLLCGSCVESTIWHFSNFEKYEVGDFDAAIASIPPRQRVQALIYDAFSVYVTHGAFAHFVGYYQLEKGGTVSFSFTGQPHWPVGYAAHHELLGLETARLGLEWIPDRVEEEPVLPGSFDYLLVRGNGRELSPQDYQRTFAGDLWSVWQPRRPPEEAAP